jgi:hypothetical protein
MLPLTVETDKLQLCPIIFILCDLTSHHSWLVMSAKALTECGMRLKMNEKITRNNKFSNRSSKI